MNLVKALMRNKNIIQKVDKGNLVVMTDQEKYIESDKSAITDSNKFVQSNIALDKYLNYIINVEKRIKQLFKNLLDNDKLVKMSMIKFVLKVPDQEYFIPILKFINQLFTTC